MSTVTLKHVYKVYENADHLLYIKSVQQVAIFVLYRGKYIIYTLLCSIVLAIFISK